MIVWLSACGTAPEPSVERPEAAVPAEEPAPTPWPGPPAPRERPVDLLADPGVPWSHVGERASRPDVIHDMQRGADAAVWCGAEATARNPELRGSVALGFDVRDHRAEGVYVASNDTGDPAFAGCLVDAMKDWAFPSVSGTTDVMWSFGADGPLMPAARQEAPVKTGSLTVDGGEAPGSVRMTVAKYMGQIKYCYQQALKRDPSVAGTVEATWTLADGRPDAVQVAGPDTVAPCVASKIRRWQFPPDGEGEIRWTVQLGDTP